MVKYHPKFTTTQKKGHGVQPRALILHLFYVLNSIQLLDLILLSNGYWIGPSFFDRFYDTNGFEMWERDPLNVCPLF